MTRPAHVDRDWDRADAWLGLTAVLLIMLLSIASSVIGGPVSFYVKIIATVAFLAHPYALLRVIRHFRDIPRSWEWLLVVGTAGIVIYVATTPSPKSFSIRVATGLYVALAQVLAALALAATARQHRGLSAWRLNVAAVGAALLALTFALQVLASNDASYGIFARFLWLVRDLAIVMLVTYYLGLVPPRFVRRMLQRGEEYRFLRQTAERAPSDRGTLVAADLAEAASRSTATAATMVLIGRGPLAVVGASRPSLIGINVTSLTGALGRVLADRTVLNGDAADLEPELRNVGIKAERFLAVPILGESVVWGTLLILQRRRSLFLNDDVAMLQRLCRHAAEILDHAQRLADERAREQREAEARLDLILESLKDYAVVTVDGQGVVTSWNVGAAQVFAYEPAEAIGRPINFLFDDMAPWLIDELERAGRGEPMISETTGRRRDDTRFTASLVIRPLQDRGRASGGFVIVMRDVSQQRTLEDRLRQAQKLEAIGRLAGGVAHDFNNMLTVIIGYAASLDEVVAPEHRAAVGEIWRAGDRAAALTRQLLAFSRQQVLRPRVVHLPDAIGSIMPMLSRLLGEHIEIIEAIEPPVPAVMADPSLLEQIVMNLAVNARDAMTNGGRLTIRVKAVKLSGADAETLTGREGVHALLEVSDTGSGMDTATQARMFEPFFTTKDVGRGTGLGLSMVYGAVHQMNGAIAVESRPGEGSTFRVYIPMHDAD
ncbi:MAG: PAS domain S-box protein [Planctomycetes bacterium]|nr:PAS domain S-box protein [Planctomycetota bacterium]